MPNPGMPFPLHPDLPPDPSDNPSGPPARVDAPQQPPAEPTTAPESRLLAGKYKTVDELEAAYSNSFSELDRIREDNRRDLDNERRRVDALLIARTPPGPPAPDPLDELQTYGVPPNLIRDAIRTEATRIARAEVQAELAPMAQGAAARSFVSRQYPDFGQREQEVADFVGSDRSLTDRYQRLYKEDPAGAMEWAYLRYAQAHPAPKPKRQSAAEDPATGALPAGAGASERTPTGQEESEREELRRAREYYKQFKDPMPYVRTRLRGLIPDSHFGQG